MGFSEEIEKMSLMYLGENMKRRRFYLFGSTV
jgi:hypothetical protein